MVLVGLTVAYSVRPNVVAVLWVIFAPSAQSSAVDVASYAAAVSLAAVPARPSSSVAPCNAGPFGCAS